MAQATGAYADAAPDRLAHRAELSSDGPREASPDKLDTCVQWTDNDDRLQTPTEQGRDHPGNWGCNHRRTNARLCRNRHAVGFDGV